MDINKEKFEIIRKIIKTDDKKLISAFHFSILKYKTGFSNVIERIL